DYIFPGSRHGYAMGKNQPGKLMKKLMGDAEMTVHGFRSSFRDWAAERTNFPREVAEMALAHAIPNAVEAAYRRGDLFEKRRRLMAAWAAYCAKVDTAGAGKVVALAGPRTPRWHEGAGPGSRPAAGHHRRPACPAPSRYVGRCKAVGHGKARAKASRRKRGGRR